MKFSAVILAGGRSSRMGRDKAFLTLQGKPLIDHSVALVRDAGAAEVLISGRAGQDVSALGCPILLDTKPDCGPLGGVERALSVAKHPLVLVLAVDLPHMTPECLRWLFADFGDGPAHEVSEFHRVPGSSLNSGDAVERVPTGSKTGAVPILRGRPEPLAAFYPKQAHEIVKRMLGENRLAARHFAEICIQEGLAGAIPVPEAYKGCFANWNAPQDMKG